MADTSRFDFCPLCGALARDGVCQSCGHVNQEIVREIEEARKAAVQQANGQPLNGQQAVPAYMQQANGQPLNGQQAVPAYMQQVNGQPVNGQQAVPAYAPPVYGQSSYPQQPCQMGYAPAVPAAQPQKKGKAAVAAVILFGVVLIAVVVLILAGIRLVQINEEEHESSFRTDYEKEEKLPEEDEHFSFPDETEADSGIEAPVADANYSFYKEDVTEQNWSEQGQDTENPYYSGPYNSLKRDLSYQIGFTETMYYSAAGNVVINIEYPQITSGNLPNQESINEALIYEYDYFTSLFNTKYKQYVTDEEDLFLFSSDAYVTYMDEKLLSVVFHEEVVIQLGYDSYSGINFYCLNFDLETGTLMENTEILRLNEAFAVDFRAREVEENGEEALTSYTDQEILEMLKDGDYLVLFYTPMGLEVGLNMDQRIVYVTYSDYESFLNTF